ncbi:Hypothetical protein KNT65_gp022 [Escherichia phage EcS1]|uniref:Uncharacterized protein n=1 Tax=Escherichia phage EcS1 TaxID=2083276 RepID=A0A2Z5ZBW7_9CAUD|nr:Hypothetical protein KNT65_gp022 [Escherichia phage EcS1]BBC78070.1 Hypothetical protein [Escherichia phage EcS1]
MTQVRPIPEVEAVIKAKDFEMYYRVVKLRTFFIKNATALMKMTDEFFLENPNYEEGAICGKRKNLQNQTKS